MTAVRDAVKITLYPNTPSGEVSSVRREDQEALADDTATSTDFELGGRQVESVGYDGGAQLTNNLAECAVRIPASDTSTVEVYAQYRLLAPELSALCEDVREVATMIVDDVPAFQGDDDEAPGS